MRYLAIDYGRRRTGLAICDRAEMLASPLAVIGGGSGAVEEILDVIKAENVEAVVIGLPLNMDDSQGPQAKIVMGFAERLKKGLDIPVYFQDERLSTFEAEQKLAGTEMSRKKKKKHLDAVAAAHILETFLERKKSE